ncbi:MAG TPA: ChaN family lipoprotein [Anaeromyxobacter sp.]|nr:ChaN family lipoprotein [Anaeromyxobacter sp.]
MSARLRLAAALLALAAGCAPRIDPRLALQPIAKRTWLSTLHRDHPLVGKIWDGRAGAFVDESALARAVEAADLVLLGEVHDNPDHHVLQARLVRTIVGSGRRPALALEMLASDLQPALDVARTRMPREPEQLAAVWKQGGWPDFELYRPVLAAGIEPALPLVAANLPRAQVRALVTDGLEAADPELRRRLEGGPELPPGAVEELRAEMMESHCGELPDEMMDPLILAQRARDATMSARLAAASGASGGILIAGKGHVRRRGVPAWLALDAPGRKAVAVAFVEVDPKAKATADYADEFGKGAFPYDFAVFTPAAARPDPCEKLRERSRAR